VSIFYFSIPFLSFYYYFFLFFLCGVDPRHGGSAGGGKARQGLGAANSSQLAAGRASPGRARGLDSACELWGGAGEL
jgi:hypothetical protein